MYLCGIVGLAAMFGRGPLGPLAPFMPISMRVAGLWMLLLGSLLGVVMFSAVGLYQWRLARLGRRMRSDGPAHF
jgi:hypothetical protein